jgi:ketosteroid isomerase-like protein
LQALSNGLAAALSRALDPLVHIILGVLVAAPAVASMVLLWAGARWSWLARSLWGNAVLGVLLTFAAGWVVGAVFSVASNEIVSVHDNYQLFPFVGLFILLIAVWLQIRARATFSRARAAGLVTAVLTPIVLIALQSQAYAAPVTLDPGSQVEQLVRERLAASWRGDKATWRRHIADDCVWVGPGLVIGTTADAEAEQIGTTDKVELKDFQTHAFGRDLVIATYLSVARGEKDGVTNLRRWRKSDTYRRVGRDWKMIQGVEVLIPTRPIAKVDPKVYDDYAGTYRLKPGVELKVWRDGDRLMMQATGQQAGSTNPAGNDVFFDDGEPGDYLFVRDGAGKVVAVVYRNEGSELRLERVG